MYKNLAPQGLGISGRHSEMIELALTYGAGGLELEMEPFHRQVESHDFEYAARFISSARIKIGPFDLPVRWEGDEGVFRNDFEQAKPLLESARQIGSRACRITVQPASDTLPYHENFEFHRQRIAELAESLASFDLKLGMAFLGPAHHREGRAHQFVSSADALVTLMKTTAGSNIGVVVDLWHWHVGGGNAEQLRDVTADQIVELRLSDVPADADLEKITERDRLLPGETGVVRTKDVLARLTEQSYDGPVTAIVDPAHLGGKKREAVVRVALYALRDQLAAAEAKAEPCEPSSLATAEVPT